MSIELKDPKDEIMEYYIKSNKELMEGLELAVRMARYLLKHTTVELNVRRKADEQLSRLERDLIPPF